MNQFPSSVTQVSLISRLRQEHGDGDGDAWFQFVDRYGRRLYGWCAARGLEHADAEDVTQNVLLRVARAIGNFQYDSRLSFRGWLRRITENAIKDFYNEQQRKPRGIQSESPIEFLASQEARTDLMASLQEAFDMELFEYATDRVRSRVSQHRWLAWKKTVMDGVAGRDVAEQLKMPIATVYAARFQIQKMITEEVAKLEEREVGV